jgi:hypothetical protein
MECVEKKLMENKEELEVKFGDDHSMIECIRRIAYKEGKLGELLSQGTKIAASKLGKGSERFAMNSKVWNLADTMLVCPRSSSGILLWTGRRLPPRVRYHRMGRNCLRKSTGDKWEGKIRVRKGKTENTL